MVFQCCVHSGKPLQKFCRSPECMTPLCTECLEEHRECRQQELVPFSHCLKEAIVFYSKSAKSIAKAVSDKGKSYRQFKLQQNIGTLEKARQYFMKELNDYFDQLVDKVRQLFFLEANPTRLILKERLAEFQEAERSLRDNKLAKYVILYMSNSQFVQVDSLIEKQSAANTIPNCQITIRPEPFSQLLGQFVNLHSSAQQNTAQFIAQASIRPNSINGYVQPVIKPLLQSHSMIDQSTVQQLKLHSFSLKQQATHQPQKQLMQPNFKIGQAEALQQDDKKIKKIAKNRRPLFAGVDFATPQQAKPTGNFQKISVPNPVMQAQNQSVAHPIMPFSQSTLSTTGHILSNVIGRTDNDRFMQPREMNRMGASLPNQPRQNMTVTKNPFQPQTLTRGISPLRTINGYQTLSPAVLHSISARP